MVHDVVSTIITNNQHAWNWSNKAGFDFPHFSIARIKLNGQSKKLFLCKAEKFCRLGAHRLGILPINVTTDLSLITLVTQRLGYYLSAHILEHIYLTHRVKSVEQDVKDAYEKVEAAPPTKLPLLP